MKHLSEVWYQSWNKLYILWRNLSIADTQRPEKNPVISNQPALGPDNEQNYFDHRQFFRVIGTFLSSFGSENFGKELSNKIHPGLSMPLSYGR